MRFLSSLCAFLCVGLASCATVPEPSQQRPESAEARSLLGSWLVPPPLPDAVRAERESQLSRARTHLENAEASVESWVWVGRRLAYLGRYRDAIDTYGEALEWWPADPHLYRHRGHRWITLRRFDLAVDDFEFAAALCWGRPDEVEPDGQPNARNIPTSTLQSNIWYHLGLARFLRGEYDKALDAYNKCIAVSKNDDMLCATLHWTWMTLRRLGRRAAADRLLRVVSADMDVIENHGYHELLLLYRGERTLADLVPEDEGDGIASATVRFGVSNWLRVNGDTQGADRLCEEITSGFSWPAFGHIAAEVDLARRDVTGM